MKVKDYYNVDICAERAGFICVISGCAALPPVSRMCSSLYDSAGKDGGHSGMFSQAAW